MKKPLRQRNPGADNFAREGRKFSVFVAKRSVLYVLYGVAAVPLLLIVGAGAWLFNDISGTAGRLEDAMLDAAGAQVPVEPGDFARLELPPESKDAAPILAQLDAQWNKISTADRGNLQQALSEKNPSPDSLAQARQFTDLLERAASCPDSAIHRDWASSESLVEPYYHSLTESCRLASSYARLRADRGDTGRAFQILSAIRKVGKHVSRDSGFDGMALHIILETIALTAAEEIAFAHASAVDDYSRFVQDRSTKPDLVRNMEGEAMRSIYILSEPDSFKDRMFSGARLSIRDQSFQRASAVRMIEFWCRAITAIRPVADDPFQARKKYIEQTAISGRERTPSSLIAATIAEWNQAKLNLNAALEVRYALAQAAIPVFESAHRHGTPPAKLTLKVSDPYGDAPLQYRRTDGGFVLSSAGRGGKPATAGPPGNRSITLTFEDGRATNHGI